jgi:uncharacterized protein YyaL (SSP411 family)
LGLLRLAALTGERDYERHAVGVLRLFHQVAVRNPDGFGHLLQALAFHLEPVREVALVGEETSALAAVVRSAYRPNLVLAGGPEGTAVPELMRDRPAVNGGPAAYVCENFTCRAPVTAPEELAAALTA